MKRKKNKNKHNFTHSTHSWNASENGNNNYTACNVYGYEYQRICHRSKYTWTTSRNSYSLSPCVYKCAFVYACDTMIHTYTLMDCCYLSPFLSPTHTHTVYLCGAYAHLPIDSSYIHLYDSRYFYTFSFLFCFVVAVVVVVCMSFYQHFNVCSISITGYRTVLNTV